MSDTDTTSRADRWAQSMAADVDRAAWERRQEEHWERLHSQLYWMPVYFILWSLGIGIVLGVAWVFLAALVHA